MAEQLEAVLAMDDPEAYICLQRAIDARIAEIEADFQIAAHTEEESQYTLFMRSKYVNEIKKGLILGFLDPHQRSLMLDLPRSFRIKVQQKQNELEKKWLKHYLFAFRVDVPEFRKWIRSRLDSIEMLESTVDHEEDEDGEWFIETARGVRKMFEKLFCGRK